MTCCTVYYFIYFLLLWQFSHFCIFFLLLSFSCSIFSYILFTYIDCKLIQNLASKKKRKKNSVCRNYFLFSHSFHAKMNETENVRINKRCLLFAHLHFIIVLSLSLYLSQYLSAYFHPSCLALRAHFEFEEQFCVSFSITKYFNYFFLFLWLSQSYFVYLTT